MRKLRKLHIYFMNAITFAVALGVIGMVGNLLVHLVNNDITGVGDLSLIHI